MNTGMALAKKTLFVLAILLFSVFSQMVLPPPAAPHTLYPSDDALVTLNSPSTNFGDLTWLQVFYSTQPAISRSYLKFDVGSITSSEVVTSATLNILCYQNNPAPNTRWVELYYVSNDSWSETVITYNNQPDDSIQYMTEVRNNTGWLTWDVDVDRINNAGDELSLMIKSKESSVMSMDFYSKEVTGISSRPYLELETQPIPLPAAIWLFSSGLLGLFGFRRRLGKR